MEIVGTIYSVLPLRSGTSQHGEWKSQSYVLKCNENGSEFFFAFDVFDGTDGRIARLNIQQGKRMRIYFNVRAHEYQGRWYNQIRAYDAREEAAPEPTAQPAASEYK